MLSLFRRDIKKISVRRNSADGSIGWTMFIGIHRIERVNNLEGAVRDSSPICGLHA